MHKGCEQVPRVVDKQVPRYMFLFIVVFFFMCCLFVLFVFCPRTLPTPSLDNGDAQLPQQDVFFLEKARWTPVQLEQTLEQAGHSLDTGTKMVHYACH